MAEAVEYRQSTHKDGQDLVLTITSLDGTKEVAKVRWPSAGIYVRGQETINGTTHMILTVPRVGSVTLTDELEADNDE